MEAKVVPSSFRDPSGFVYWEDAVLYRQINRVYAEHYDRLLESGLYDCQPCVFGADGPHLWPLLPQTVHGLPCVIVRAVVDDDELEIFIRLRTDGFDRFRQQVGTVIGRYDYADNRVAHRWMLLFAGAKPIFSGEHWRLVALLVVSPFRANQRFVYSSASSVFPVLSLN